jgi:hypothetical protein
MDSVAPTVGQPRNGVDVRVKGDPIVRRLRQNELDRLVRSHRNLKISALVTLLLVVPVIVGLIAVGVPVLVGPVVGVGIGMLLLVPQRRLLNELGLTNVEAKQILQEERDRRAGVPKATRRRPQS